MGDKMIKKKKLLVAIPCCFIVICLLIYISPLRSFVYFGDRIKGDISVYLDGDQIDLSKANFDGVRISDKGKSVTLKDKGKGYGSHTFNISLQEIDCPITLKVYQWDWHQITRFDCSIYFENTESGLTARYESVNRMINENKKTTDEFSKEFDDTAEGIEVFIG